MTDDTTTIEIREDQRDELKALKAHDRESYKAVMDRLLDGPDADGDTDAEVPPGILALEDMDADAIADAVAARGVSLDAGERKAIAEEVVGMLR